MELHEALAMCAALTPPACACAPDLPDDAVIVSRLYANSRSGPDNRALAEPVSRSIPPKRSSSKKKPAQDWHSSSKSGRVQHGSASGPRSGGWDMWSWRRSGRHANGVAAIQGKADAARYPK